MNILKQNKEYITDILLMIERRIEFKNNAGLFDENKTAEDFYCGLLNLFFGWNLVNANNILNKNYPAVDLVDSVRKIAVQVTSECTSNKVHTTIKSFLSNSLYEDFNELYIMMIKRKPDFPNVNFQKTAGTNLIFDKKKHIIDNLDLSRKLDDIGQDKIGRIKEYLILNYKISYEDNISVEEDLDIIDEIFKYINSNIKSLKFDIQKSDNFSIDLNKKISLNFSNGQENDIKEKITNLMNKKNLVDQYMKDNDDTQLQLDLKDFIQTNYRTVRDTSNIDEAINEVIFIDKLADFLLPTEKMVNPHYRANANAIVLYFFEMCDFGRKTDIENNKTEQLFD